MTRSAAGAMALALAVLATPVAAQDTHTVAPGETLGGIANRAGVSMKALAEENGLEAPYPIRAGQKLAIPRGATRAIAARSASADGPETYTVKAGETLGGIANRQQVPRVLIIEANRLKEPYTLRVGQKLLIPRTRHHTVKAGDTGFGIAMDYGVPWRAIAVANGMGEGDAVRIGQKLLIPTVFENPPTGTTQAPSPAPTGEPAFAWPLRGDIRRQFKERGAGDYHDGLDILAAKGEAVRSVAPGKVIFADDEPSQFGKLVVVDHGNGWHSAYGSLERVTVKVGEQLGKGERLGLVGNTSITRQTELHFELRKDGKPVDPLTKLP